MFIPTLMATPHPLPLLGCGANDPTHPPAVLHPASLALVQVFTWFPRTLSKSYLPAFPERSLTGTELPSFGDICKWYTSNLPQALAKKFRSVPWPQALPWGSYWLSKGLFRGIPTGYLELCIIDSVCCSSVSGTPSSGHPYLRSLSLNFP